ncbi:unnamed protein product [Acanthosepion pharaonis]|uniref:Uncharacterized protein n=1 Tax=Acanthosepion pharaonis TaxID=158019 RepID=A0A812E9Y0_ACAPH|nr:unnamed protein product [Sepia pharaonis]
MTNEGSIIIDIPITFVIGSIVELSVTHCFNTTTTTFTDSIIIMVVVQYYIYQYFPSSVILSLPLLHIPYHNQLPYHNISLLTLFFIHIPYFFLQPPIMHPPSLSLSQHLFSFLLLCPTSSSDPLSCFHILCVFPYPVRFFFLFYQSPLILQFLPRSLFRSLSFLNENKYINKTLSAPSLISVSLDLHRSKCPCPLDHSKTQRTRIQERVGSSEKKADTQGK